MIISQDKKTIVNFQNIMYIEIAENKKTIRCQQKNLNLWLGNYRTEERAKEILQEISDFENCCEIFKTGMCSLTDVGSVHNMFVYEMPQQ